MIILVTGGRHNENKASARKALTPFRSVKNILISGGANGWDYICEQVWGGEFQLPYVVVPAAWDRMGKAAGPARNIHMVRGNSLAPHATLVPDVVVAGKGGRGTAHCVRTAEEAGIEVVYAES